MITSLRAGSLLFVESSQLVVVAPQRPRATVLPRLMETNSAALKRHSQLAPNIRPSSPAEMAHDSNPCRCRIFCRRLGFSRRQGSQKGALPEPDPPRITMVSPRSVQSSRHAGIPALHNCRRRSAGIIASRRQVGVLVLNVDFLVSQCQCAHKKEPRVKHEVTTTTTNQFDMDYRRAWWSAPTCSGPAPAPVLMASHRGDGHAKHHRSSPNPLMM